jgi:DNA-binding transcriptional LysR family regulator
MAVPFDDMRVLVAVASSGGVRAAASALGVPRSTISRRLSALERRLGVALVRRDERRSELTDVGRRYYERASAILREAESLDREMSAAGVEPTGTLRVAVPAVFGQEVLAGIVATYLRKHPRVRLVAQIVAGPIDLGEGRFDVAVLAGAAPRSPTLVARVIGRPDLVCVASAEYVAARGAPRAPADLAAHDLISFGGETASGGWLFVVRGVVHEQPVAPRYMVNDFRAAYTAALAGAGIVRVPRMVCGDDVAGGRLVALLEDATPAPLTLHLVYPASHREVPAVRGFVRVIDEVLLLRPWLNAVQGSE